ncbi:MAG: hypothetical protein ABJK43_00010 [Lentilitoribacter sp.]
MYHPAPALKQNFGIGNSERAHKCLLEAISELKILQNNDPDSMWVQSRLSWAMWVGNRLRWDNPDFSDQKNLLRKLTSLRGCDPDLILDTFRSEFKDALTKHATKKELVPKFDTGVFKDSSQSISFGGPSWARHHYGFLCVLAFTGIPLKTDYVNYAATTAQQAYELNKQQTVDWYLGLLSTHPGYDSDLINEHFSRIAIAQMEPVVVSKATPRIVVSIEFWRDRLFDQDKNYSGFAVERLRTLIEVLARLSIRMSSEEAIHHFELGCELANDNRIRHWWLFGPLTNLIKNTYSAVAPKDRKKLTFLTLDFPFAADVSDPTEREWPDIATIAYDGLQYDGAKTKLRSKITDFIQRLSKDDKARAEAALRLTYLLDAKLLNKVEERQFSDALWKGVEQQDDALPAQTTLYPHIFIWLPSPENVDVRKLVYKTLYEPGENEFEGLWNAANAIVVAARALRAKLVPKADKAERMFEAITKWRPKKSQAEESPFGFGSSAKKQVDRSIGSVLSFAVIDQMNRASVTTDNAEKVMTLIKKAGLTTAIPALIPFLGLDDDMDQKIIKRIRHAITSQDHAEIVDGVLAITKWLEAGRDKTDNTIIPRSVVSGVLKALFRAPELGLSSLLECAQSLLQYGQFNTDEISELVELLEDLFALLDYTKIEAGDPRGIGTPMARLQCMVLSRILLDSGCDYPIFDKWISSQPQDPLPEIRNATLNKLAKSKS